MQKTITHLAYLFLVTTLSFALTACNTPPAASPGHKSGPTTPKLIESATPIMTPEMHEKMPGVVVVIAEVGPNGTVTGVRIHASADPVFNNACIQAAMKHRYEPAMLEGVPAASESRLVFTFYPDERKVEPLTARQIAKPLAKVGETSPGNPYAGKPFSINGGIKQGKMSFVIGMQTKRYDAELTVTDNSRSLLAKDKQGKTVFNGPVNNETQWAPLNQDLRYILERLNQGVVGGGN